MGSGGQGQGGGIYFFGDATPVGSAIHGGSISNNQAPSDGGGIYTTDALTIDQGTVISGNSSGRNGGGLWNNATGATTLTNVTFVNNSATAAGGGIRNDSNAGATLNVSFSRIVGNTAPSGSGVSRSAGTLTAEDNWWGCNYGPGATGERLSCRAQHQRRRDRHPVAPASPHGQSDVGSHQYHVSTDGGSTGPELRRSRSGPAV